MIEKVIINDIIRYKKQYENEFKLGEVVSVQKDLIVDLLNKQGHERVRDSEIVNIYTKENNPEYYL